MNKFFFTTIGTPSQGIRSNKVAPRGVRGHVRIKTDASARRPYHSGVRSNVRSVFSVGSCSTLLAFLCVFASLLFKTYAGTNACLTYRTNDWIVEPTGIWASNAAAIQAVITNGGGTNSTLFAPVTFATNGSGQIVITGLDATTLSNLVPLLSLPGGLATLSSNNAGNLTNLPGGGIVGTIPLTNLVTALQTLGANNATNLTGFNPNALSNSLPTDVVTNCSSNTISFPAGIVAQSGTFTNGITTGSGIVDGSYLVVNGQASVGSVVATNGNIVVTNGGKFAGDGSLITNLSVAAISNALPNNVFTNLSTNNFTYNGSATYVGGLAANPGFSVDPVSGIVTGNQFSGSGAGLTGLPAAQLTGKASSLILSNNQYAGTNQWTGDLAFPWTSLGTLVAGNNTINVGTWSAVDLSGPSGAFTVASISGTNIRDGRILYVRNATGYAMTLANESGFDPTASDRIHTGTGVDLLTSGNPVIAQLVYRSSRWEVVSVNGTTLTGSFTGTFNGSFTGSGETISNTPPTAVYEPECYNLPASMNMVTAWTQLLDYWGTTNGIGTNTEVLFTNTIIAMNTNGLLPFASIYAISDGTHQGRDANGNLTMSAAFSHPLSWYTALAHSNGVKIFDYLSISGVSAEGNPGGGPQNAYQDVQFLMSNGVDGIFLAGDSANSTNPIPVNAGSLTNYEFVLQEIHRAVADYNYNISIQTNVPLQCFGITGAGIGGNAYNTVTSGWFAGLTPQLLNGMSSFQPSFFVNAGLSDFDDYLTGQMPYIQNPSLFCGPGHFLEPVTIYGAPSSGAGPTRGWQTNIVNMLPVLGQALQFQFGKWGDPFYTNGGFQSDYMGDVKNFYINTNMLDIWKDGRIYAGTLTYTNLSTKTFIYQAPLDQPNGSKHIINVINTNSTAQLITCNVTNFNGYSNLWYQLFEPISGTIISNFQNSFTFTVAANSCNLLKVSPATLFSHVDANHNIQLAANQLDAVTPSGSDNVVVGDYAASYTTLSGNDNTLVGFASGPYAGGTAQNTALGSESLWGYNGTMTGNNNTAIGYRALDQITSGNHNVCVAGDGGVPTTTGSDNIFLFTAAHFWPTVVAGTNNIDIGGTGSGDESGTTRIGSTQTTAYIAGVVTATNGFASKQARLHASFLATSGCTNNLTNNLILRGVTGTSVVVSNTVTGVAVSLGTITAPTDIELNLNETLTGSSMACAGTNAAFER